MTKANVPPNVTPNVTDIHTYTLRTLLRVYRHTDDGKKEILKHTYAKQIFLFSQKPMFHL